MAFAENKNPVYDHIDAKKQMGERNGTQAGGEFKSLPFHHSALAYTQHRPLQGSKGLVRIGRYEGSTSSMHYWNGRIRSNGKEALRLYR
jgi:hypothetical protein